jgi:ankyrin repeat protein
VLHGKKEIAIANFESDLDDPSWSQLRAQTNMRVYKHALCMSEQPPALQPDEDVNAADSHGFTPIYIAARDGDTARVFWLAERGADVN